MKTFKEGEIVLVRDHRLNTYTRCVYVEVNSEGHWVTHVNAPIWCMEVRDEDITTQFDLDINALDTPFQVAVGHIKQLKGGMS